MVSRLAASLGPLREWTQGVLAATSDVLAETNEKAEPLIMRLDPPLRAKVLMALIGLIVVGLGLVLFIILGGQRLRRIAKESPAVTPPGGDEWYRKPLNGNEPNHGDDANAEPAE
jgi:hypothetical protein